MHVYLLSSTYSFSLSFSPSPSLSLWPAHARIHFDLFSWKRVFHYSLRFHLLWQPRSQPTETIKILAFFHSHLFIVQSEIGNAVSKMHMRVDVICAATMRYENHYSFWSNHVGHDASVLWCSHSTWADSTFFSRLFRLPFLERNAKQCNQNVWTNVCHCRYYLLRTRCTYLRLFRFTFSGHFLFYYLLSQILSQ